METMKGIAMNELPVIVSNAGSDETITSTGCKTMEKNPIITILEKQDRERKQRAAQSEWNLNRHRRLVDIIEKDGEQVSDYMYEQLYVRINELRVNENGKVCYLSFYPPSKRVISILTRHNDAIRENLHYITS